MPFSKIGAPTVAGELWRKGTCGGIDPALVLTIDLFYPKSERYPLIVLVRIPEKITTLVRHEHCVAGEPPMLLRQVL
jgi:hypothetical protein